MRVRRIITVILVTVANAALFGAWGGALDGDQHPMVGAVYLDFNSNGRIEWFELLCSGAYAGPSKTGTAEVFLTAGHCVAPLNTLGGFSDFWVSFDENPRDGLGVPENLILANSFAWDTRFGHDEGNLYDSAVLLLPRGSVTDLIPVELPPAGYLDALKRAGSLQHRTFELVGYGVVPVWQQAGGTEFFFDGQRRTSLSQVKALTQAWLQFNQDRYGRPLFRGLRFAPIRAEQPDDRLDDNGWRRQLPREQSQLPTRLGRGARVPLAVSHLAVR